MNNNKINYHLIISTSFGNAAVIYREKPFSVIEILLPHSSRKDLINAVGREKWGKSGSHKNAKIISRSIIEYFKGRPDKTLQLPWEWLDMGGLTRLQQSVLAATADIPYGELRSYKEVAEAVHHPRAYRFVGTTLAKNPFPIVIPCHRVIRSDGSYGQFGGGTDLKRKMIELEARFAK